MTRHGRLLSHRTLTFVVSACLCAAFAGPLHAQDYGGKDKKQDQRTPAERPRIASRGPDSSGVR